MEFNGAAILSIEFAPRGGGKRRDNTISEGEVEAARLRTWRWHSARR
jgi:hypothetical protein